MRNEEEGSLRLTKKKTCLTTGAVLEWTSYHRNKDSLFLGDVRQRSKGEGQRPCREKCFQRLCLSFSVVTLNLRTSLSHLPLFPSIKSSSSINIVSMLLFNVARSLHPILSGL